MHHPYKFVSRTVSACYASLLFALTTLLASCAQRTANVTFINSSTVSARIVYIPNDCGPYFANRVSRSACVFEIGPGGRVTSPGAEAQTISNPIYTHGYFPDALVYVRDASGLSERFVRVGLMDGMSILLTSEQGQWEASRANYPDDSGLRISLADAAYLLNEQEKEALRRAAKRE